MEQYKTHRKQYTETVLKQVPALAFFLKPRKCSRTGCRRTESQEVAYANANKFSICGRCLINAYCSVKW